MKQRRRTEITIETRTITLVRQRRDTSLKVWCDGCAAEAEMLNPEQAAALVELDTRTLYRQVEAGLLHFQELADGRLLLCLSSLLTANHSKEISL